MRTNESTVDRVIRLVIAVAAVGASAAIGFGTVGGIILLVVAGIMAVTAAVGFCPLYALFGFSTCPVRQG
jgi:hypothetical protein